MNSITRHLTALDIVAQIRLERQKHKGAFFLMEGSNDIRRFEKFLHLTSVSVVVCWGKKNVLETIDIIQNAGQEDCLGFVDADFDRCLNCLKCNEDIVNSDCHDFDMDICKGETISRYLLEVSEESAIESEGGCDKLIISLLDSLRPLSALRFANEKHSLGYYLKDLNHEDFFDGRILDIGALIAAVSNGRYSASHYRATLRSHIDRYAGASFDPWQFTNGHDLMAALGIALRQRIGNRRPPQTWRREVERHLRLAFDFADFHSSALARRIAEWESTREGLTVLKRVAWASP